jgi:hypothetical protein
MLLCTALVDFMLSSPFNRVPRLPMSACSLRPGGQNPDHALRDAGDIHPANHQDPQPFPNRCKSINGFGLKRSVALFNVLLVMQFN